MVLPLIPSRELWPAGVDLVRWYLAMVLVSAILAWGWWYNHRHVLSINRVAVTPHGLYPPFKPKRRLSKGDWFVPYKDIISMEPVGEQKRFTSAYDLTLKDGLAFSLNTLDILLYVDEARVRQYSKVLGVVREELSKPENRAKASRDEDIVIPREAFGRVLR